MIKNYDGSSAAECLLCKEKVVGSNPIHRSNKI